MSEEGVQEGDATTLARAVVGLLVALARPKAVALWSAAGEGWRLLLSERIDQDDLDALAALDAGQRRMFEAGGAGVLDTAPARFVMPALRSARFSGVLMMRPVPDLGRLPRAYLPVLGALLAHGIEAWRTGARATPGAGGVASAERVFDSAQALNEREELVSLLERHEWNLSRVARLLGVTRMTVYNRLRRFGLTRQRRRKPGRRPAGPR